MSMSFTQHCIRSTEETIRTVQNLAPQGQTLQNISILLRMIMTKSSPMLATTYCEIMLRVFRLGWMEIAGQVFNHPFARITIRSEEGMVVANTIQTLSNAIPIEVLVFVPFRENFDCVFLSSNFLLNCATGATF